VIVNHRACVAQFALFVLLVLSVPAGGAQITVDLSGIINSDLTTYSSGGNYPIPGPITIGGIGFQLTKGSNGHTWVAGGGASVGTPMSYSVTGLNLASVDTMYAIINSGFGVCGTSVGSIGASTLGSSASFGLVEGQNVRDHYNDGYCNSATDAIATADYTGGIRFDVYRFDLSALTNKGTIPIAGLDFATLGKGGGGEPFLAAVTFTTAAPPVGTIPEPSTWTLLVLGGALCCLRRVH